MNVVELSKKRQEFVRALFSDDAPAKGQGLILFAARAAGSGTATNSNQSLSVIGGRIAYDDRVQAAIAEYSRKVMRTIPPAALRALKDLIANPDARNHMKAIAAVIDRTDPLQTTHNVIVDHRSERQLTVATAEVIARIHELAKRAGLPKLPPPIDAEFAVVSEGTAP